MNDNELNEIRNNLKEKLGLNIQACLDELNELQRDLKWRFVQPNIKEFNQKYQSFHLDRLTLHWSFRQKRAQYESLKIEMQTFIEGLVLFEYEKKETPIQKIDNQFLVSGNHNTLFQQTKDSPIQIDNSQYKSSTP